MADDTYSRGYRNDPYGRGGTVPSGQPTDPLAERARLIGQSDPVAADGRRSDARTPDTHAQAPDWRTEAQPQVPYENGAPYDRYGGSSDPQHYADNGHQ